MSVGLTVTKPDIDAAAGAIARDLRMALQRVEYFKFWLDAQVDGDLTALGFSAGEIASLRSAYADAAQLATLYNGTATLGVAKDFRTFLRRLWGLAIP